MNVGLHPAHRRINVVSICTGGGGLDLGLELAIPGYRSIAYVEREAFACAHLVAAMEQGLLAPAPLWSDARTFPGRQYRGQVDCLIGGIPCQPHSVAGKRLGREDERDLWSAFRRILVQTGAWCSLIENVQGMVTSGGLERVWRDLRRLGFEIEAGLFSAEEVGASHGRERLFVLAVHRSALGKLADSNRQRPQGQRADAAAQGRQDARRQVGLCGGANLVHAAGERRGERRAESELWRGRSAAAGDGEWPLFAPAPGSELWRTVAALDPLRLPALSRYDLFIHACRTAGLDPHGDQRGAGRAAPRAHAPQLQEIAQSTLRGVADGVAGPLDPDRIDALRMLGNGVVPLAGAHAVRSLGVALARRHGTDPARFIWGVT